MNYDLQCWANISSILTLIITATATAVGIWGYLSYRYDQRQKRRRLEQYLEKQKKTPGAKSQLSLLHLVRHVGLTEDELIQISFKSPKIERLLKVSRCTFAQVGAVCPG